MNAQSALPIRRLTLYKHGIGIVEREGQLAGDEVALTLRSGEVNDVLKSLLVGDRRGGRVLGVRYETPTDRQARLAAVPLALTPDHSLLDLLRALRGQEVRLVVGDGAQAEEVNGRLVGIDLPPGETPLAPTTVSVLDEAADTVTTVVLDRVRRVVLRDERGAHDLRFFLDSSRSDEAQRTITLRLSPGEHDLTLSYVVPSPTWRVGYRLVAESAPASTPESDGELVLQGWGLFDNTWEEDLDEVDVTLVAGQPISFVYDLAASRVPRRPVVHDVARVAAAPVEFEGVVGEGAEPRAPGVAAMAPMRHARPHAPYDAKQPMQHDLSQVDAPAFLRAVRVPSIEEMVRQDIAASGSELGELFQYHVTVPVTVRRGDSAMAPILQARLPYRRELLFNERKLPLHPVAALRFQNRSGAVLERGPVTVYEDGAYRGEALVPFAKEGDDVYLAFAVELGIRVTTTTAHSVETVGIGIADALLHIKQATVIRVTYRLANTLPAPCTVTVEHPITPNFELTATRPPDARTADVYRWNLACSPRDVTLFRVEERHYAWQTQRLLDYSYAALQEYLSERWLDKDTLAQIAPILEARSRIDHNEREIAALLAERDVLYKRQEHLRKNMAALGTAGDEGTLRARAVGQLRAGEDRLDAIDGRLAALKDENSRLQEEIGARLNALRAGELPDTGGAPAPVPAE
jgi:hypothetical protein